MTKSFLRVSQDDVRPGWKVDHKLNLKWFLGAVLVLRICSVCEANAFSLNDYQKDGRSESGGISTVLHMLKWQIVHMPDAFRSVV